MAKNALKRAKQVFDIEMKAIAAVRRQLDRRFVEAVEMIAASVARRGKVVVVGVGKSGNIGRKIAATFSSTGSMAVVLNSVDALHGDIGVVSDGDIILAISYSGETEELVRLLPALKRFNVKIVALTAHRLSTVGRHSDVVVSVKIPKEACPFNLAPTSSTTATLVMGDALAMAVLEERGFTQRDFARLHPAGSIGQSLLLKVSDIMRTGTRLAKVPQGSDVRSAVDAMMKARSGSICIVDRKGRLAGIFTDGDLRRHFGEPGISARKVDELMTRKPVTIRDTALAAEALRIFNAHAIDDLVVVDKLKRPVGLVDSQDLPKLKVL